MRRSPTGRPEGADRTRISRWTVLLPLLALLGPLAACGGAPPEENGPGDDPAATPGSVPAALDTSVSVDTVSRAPADTTPRGRFFVRVVASADPAAVARRHGLTPSRVYTEEATAFVAVLTGAEIEALQADSLVISLAQQIESETARTPEVRGVPISDSGGG